MPNYAQVKELGLIPEEVESRVAAARSARRRRAARLWGYYRNPMMETAGGDDDRQARPYRQYQEWGMPSRLTGYCAGAEFGLGQRFADIARKEILCDNQIGWRVDTKTEYLVGKPVLVRSAAAVSDQRAAQLTSVIRGILAAAGGNILLQQVATLCHIHGCADIMVRLEDTPTIAHSWLPPRMRGAEHDKAASWADLGEEPDAAGRDEASDAERARLRSIGSHIRATLIEPSQPIPFLAPDDWRTVRVYGTVVDQKGVEQQDEDGRPWWHRWLGVLPGPTRRIQTDNILVDLVGGTRWQRYVNGQLVAHGVNGLGELPLVHFKLDADPFAYAGRGDVEPLIPLQDELNIRLSDRSQRITMTSFQMYLGKGIENFNNLPVGPGRMWSTENTQASIETFGGDAEEPNEFNHLAHVLESMDKTSKVSPVAAGAIRDKVGNLTSAAALRLTLIALLSETVQKRGPFGAALQRMVELGLSLLDKSGLFHTTPQERRIEISWPSPLPENLTEALAQAESKLRIGVPPELVLAEVGYEVEGGPAPAERRTIHVPNAATPGGNPPVPAAGGRGDGGNPGAPTVGPSAGAAAN